MRVPPVGCSAASCSSADRPPWSGNTGTVAPDERRQAIGGAPNFRRARQKHEDRAAGVTGGLRHGLFNRRRWRGT